MADSSTLAYELDGPVLLLAGPGTGKTYQLAKRIKFLVEERDVDPDQIAVITFTAAAAANMRARISDPKRHPDLFLAHERQPSLICTMHSLGFRIIRENASILSLPEMVSVVRSDFIRKILMGDAAQLVGLSRADAETTLTCRQHGACQRDDSPKCRICARYGDIFRACNAIDHDDQILLSCRLLRDSAEVAAVWRTRCCHLLVDEYQDINAGQYELIRRLSQGKEDGLFVVGDDDQSIYSWRGGSPVFIRGFEQHFGERARVVPLTHSRRCHKNILEGALAIVKATDKSRRDKGPLTYEHPDGPKPVIHSVPSDKGEAGIIQAIVAGAIPSRDVLILVPNRNYSVAICQALRRSRIPYVAPEPLPGQGLPILERLCRWLQENGDSLALRECIDALLNSKGSPLPSAHVRKKEKKDERERGLAPVSDLWQTVVDGGVSLWESLQSAQGRTVVLGFLKDRLRQLQVCAASDDVAALLQHAAASLDPWSNTRELAEEVETWVSRFAESADSESTTSVRVMTFQGAKGLEADVVCAVGLEEGTLPRRGASGEELEEQSRLMYVSMTRTKYELHLFHARTRSAAVSYQQLHGPAGMNSLVESRFLSAIDPAFCEQRYHRART